jgi:hypothetical protein
MDLRAFGTRLADALHRSGLAPHLMFFDGLPHPRTELRTVDHVIATNERLIAILSPKVA